MALGYAQIAASKANAARSAGIAAGHLRLSRDQFEFAKKEAVMDRERSDFVTAYNMADRL
jgi:hypothetical protein